MSRAKVFTKAELAFIERTYDSQTYSLETLNTPEGDRNIIRGYKTKASCLTPNPWNPNKQKARTQKATTESLKTFGQVLECVVVLAPKADGSTDDFLIVDGEHRFNGLSTEQDADVSVNILFGYSETEQKKLTVILNETRGEADKIELASLLSGIAKEFEGNDLRLGLPYSSTELDELMSLTDVDWAEFSDEFSQGEEPEESEAENSEAPSPSSQSENTFVGSQGPTPQAWTDFLARVPSDSTALIFAAKEEIEKNNQLDSDLSIAWGQILKLLAASFIENGGADAYN